MTGSNGYSAKRANTSDDGYIQVGLVNTNATSITADQTANNVEIQLKTNGSQDFIVMKMNSDNKVEWAGQFGSSLLDETATNVKAVIELPNNRYLVQVYLSAKATIPSEQTTLGEDVELLGNVTLIYNSDGLIEYASSEVSSSSQYNSVVATSDGGQIAVGQFKGRLHIDAEQTSNNERIQKDAHVAAVRGRRANVFDGVHSRTADDQIRRPHVRRTDAAVLSFGSRLYGAYARAVLAGI